MEIKPYELKTKTTPDENWDYARIVEWSNNDFDQADRIWEQLHKDELAAEEEAANEKSAVAAKNNMNGYADYLRRNNANRAFTSRDAAKLFELADPVDNEVADTLSYGQAKEAEADAQIRNQLIAKIADIENRIAELDGEIEEASKPIVKKGLSDNDLYKKIAANEMRKWNSSDPTSFWRWEKAREDTKEKEEYERKRLENEKKESKDRTGKTLAYKVNNYIDRYTIDDNTSDSEKKLMLSNLEDLKIEAENAGRVDLLNKLDQKIKNIKNSITSESQLSYTQKILKNLQTKFKDDPDGLLNAINQFKEYGVDLTNIDVDTEVNEATNKAKSDKKAKVKKENAEANAKADKALIKSYTAQAESLALNDLEAYNKLKEETRKIMLSDGETSLSSKINWPL